MFLAALAHAFVCGRRFCVAEVDVQGSPPSRYPWTKLKKKWDEFLCGYGGGARVGVEVLPAYPEYTEESE